MPIEMETTIRSQRLKFAASIVLLVMVFTGLVSCGGGGGGSGREVMIIPPGNRAPTVAQAFSNLSFTHEPANPQEWLSEDLDTYFRDPDLYDSLGYHATSSNQGVAGAGIRSNRFSPGTHFLVVTPYRAGTTVITVVASDISGLSVSQRFTVTVHEENPRPPNRAPTVAQAFSNLSFTHEPANPQEWLSEDLETYFRDPDLYDSLGYHVTSSNQGVAGAGIRSNRFSPGPHFLVVTPYRAGTTVITVVASDISGLSVSQRFTVTVHEENPRPPNRAPTVAQAFSNLSLTHEPANPQEWLSEDLETYFRDPDLYDSLGYHVTSSNQGVAGAGIREYLSNPGTHFLVVTPHRAGTTVITVVASDISGLSVSQRFTVTVR